ncbi:hypothetical protein BKA62DRAFT_685773 [Auriculariales sp. MPI-PUGE-AT-0066]|nr:hypothetical protein BKA62DRAFT_685773 [Auriculariales sp. MPI-PUGE-AT-0066]
MTTQPHDFIPCHPMRTTPEDQRANIVLRHPHNDSVILKLTARRNTAESVVLDGCRVVAQYYGADSYIATTAGEGALSHPHARVFAGTYYFHIPHNRRYTVCKQFGDWRPPRRSGVPGHWFTSFSPQSTTIEPPQGRWADGNTSDFSKLVQVAITKCILSGRMARAKSVEAARIVPRYFDEWFQYHDLLHNLQYGFRLPRKVTNPLDDIRNGIVLDAGCHSAFDDWVFIFIPFGDYWVCAFLDTDIDTSAAQFHMCRADMPTHIDSYLLFIRFALTILGYIPDFQMPTDRKDIRPSLLSEVDNMTMNAAPRSPSVLSDRARTILGNQRAHHQEQEKQGRSHQDGRRRSAVLDSNIEVSSNAAHPPDKRENDDRPELTGFADTVKAMAAEGIPIPPDFEAIYRDILYPRHEQDQLADVIMRYKQANPNYCLVGGGGSHNERVTPAIQTVSL